jgi:hypothetical protein
MMNLKTYRTIPFAPLKVERGYYCNQAIIHYGTVELQVYHHLTQRDDDTCNEWLRRIHPDGGFLFEIDNDLEAFLFEPASKQSRYINYAAASDDGAYRAEGRILARDERNHAGWYE